MQWTTLADKLGLPRIASVQNAYSMAHRAFDEGSPEICFREKISLLAYSPLAFGQLSGKYADDANADGRLNQFAKTWSPRWRNPRLVEAAREYAKLARDNGLTPAAMALAWCKSRWFVTSTIIGTTSVEQMRENLDAFSLTLAPELLQKNRRHPREKRHAGGVGYKAASTLRQTPSSTGRAGCLCRASGQRILVTKTAIPQGIPRASA